MPRAAARPPDGGPPVQDRRPLAVELFSGTAGLAAAFRRLGWQVVTVDFQRRFRPDVVADVRALPLAISRRPAFLWASPPCNEFSEANPSRPPRPSLDLIFATLEAVRDLHPLMWALENVRGAIPYLGVPLQKVGPWCLWGYFPPIRPSWAAQTYRKLQHHTAVARAAIPLELAAAVAETVAAHLVVPSLLDMRPWRRHRHRAARSAVARAAARDLFE